VVKSAVTLSELRRGIRQEISLALANCPLFVNTMKLFIELEIEYLGYCNGMHTFLSGKTGSTFSVLADRELTNYEIERHAKKHVLRYFRIKGKIENQGAKNAEGD